MFELELLRTENKNSAVQTDKLTSTVSKYERRTSQGARNILLKGQMRYISDMKAIIFLCSPM